LKLAWSTRAVEEVHSLRRYSVDHWGQAVALRYLADLRDAAKTVARSPERARPLRPPYRLLPVRSHVLILHVDETAGLLTVARVLHAAMDIGRHLP
jgi:plasmid stabilization system protein ParE